MARQHRINEARRSNSASSHFRRRAVPKLPVRAECAHHNTTNTKETAVRHTLRPYATVGVAIVGAGLFAATPVTAPLPDINTIGAVALTAADSDLLAPWIDQYNIASADATKLLNTFYDAPNIGLQQFIANMSGYLQQFFLSPTSSSVTSAMGQIQENLAGVVTGYGLQGASAGTTSTVLSHTLDSYGLASGHATLFGEIPGYLPASDAAEITPIINFLASPASGILMGDIGPWISPWVALGNSISAGDNFNETLANMFGAFFNGATLNLDALLPAINGADLFPAGMEMTELDIGFGGLFSTGSVGGGALGDGAVGGSIFNSVGLFLSGVPYVGSINAPSQAIGPIGAWEAWGQTIASLLGWDGTGSPLAGVTLPVIPDDAFDAGAGASAAATDLSSLWTDLISALGF